MPLMPEDKSREDSIVPCTASFVSSLESLEFGFLTADKHQLAPQLSRANGNHQQPSRQPAITQHSQLKKRSFAPTIPFTGSTKGVGVNGLFTAD